jgi:hypothetical protein
MYLGAKRTTNPQHFIFDSVCSQRPRSLFSFVFVSPIRRSTAVDKAGPPAPRIALWGGFYLMSFIKNKAMKIQSSEIQKYL